jgi:hypothetical protein
MTTHALQDRRQSSIHISDESVARIAAAISQDKGHTDCRFSDIELDDMREAVNFVKNFNVAMRDSRTVVRRFFLVASLTAGSGYMVYGYWAKITDTIRKLITNTP